MRIIEKRNCLEFPFDWINLDFYPESEGKKIEIISKKTENKKENMIDMFNKIFIALDQSIYIYFSSWWDYTLDTWNIQSDNFDYSKNNKHITSKKYINLLEKSEIEIGYSGCCSCNDYVAFLKISLNPLLQKKAPYSHLFFNVENNYFFYYHHTGEIGLYYKEKNLIVGRIIDIASKEYNVIYY